MQALIKEDQKPAALKEAEACVVAGKASRTHCKWLATAWRYYGMLLALNGKMPEALLALSNAIDLAKSKPTDDSLALARAHDAMGRTLVEMNNVELGLKELKKAYEVFKVRGVADGQEALATWNVIKQLRPDI
jgi:tetratricopeptide (TPR) repeat protein